MRSVAWRRGSQFFLLMPGSARAWQGSDDAKGICEHVREENGDDTGTKARERQLNLPHLPASVGGNERSGSARCRSSLTDR